MEVVGGVESVRLMGKQKGGRCNNWVGGCTVRTISRRGGRRKERRGGIRKEGKEGKKRKGR